MSFFRPNRLLLAGAAAAALGLGTAPAATASDARVADGVLRVTAAPGEANDVLLAPGSGADVAVSDLGAAPETGPGCADEGDVAVCGGAGSVVVALGDGDDSAGADPGLAIAVTIDGGAGSDSLGGGGGPATLRGGAGDDLLSGGDAADVLDPGAGADYVVGAGGADTIQARDGSVDMIACGDGQDSVSADPEDNVDGDCESVSTTSAPPSGGTGGSGGGSTGTGSEPGTTTGQPGGSGGGSGSGSGGAVKRRPRDFAWCSTHGSRTTILCSVRLLRRHPSGALRVTLRSGGVVVASGRGRVTRGVARLRLRTRMPVVGGRYALGVLVDRRPPAKPVTRTLGVDILGGAAVR